MTTLETPVTELPLPDIRKPILAVDLEVWRKTPQDWDKKSYEMSDRLYYSMGNGLVAAILQDHKVERPTHFADEEGKVKFMVLSEEVAAKRIFNEPYIHISIAGVGSGNISPHPSNLPHLQAFLPLQFDDCISSDIQGFYPISNEQIAAIWDVVEKHRGNYSLVVVNCHAGLCRSSAVAAAIADRFYGRTYSREFFATYAPNKYVFNEMKKKEPHRE